MYTPLKTGIKEKIKFKIYINLPEGWLLVKEK